MIFVLWEQEVNQFYKINWANPKAKFKKGGENTMSDGGATLFNNKNIVNEDDWA